MFKRGDKVICIDNLETGKLLKLNGIYTIKRANDTKLWLHEARTGVGYFYIERFKKYTHRKEKLERILCLK